MKDHLAGVTPLPFGERTAPQRRWHRSGQWFRVSSGLVRRVMIAGGVIACLCGAVLVAWPAPQIRVSVEGGSYEVDGNQLVEVAPGWYRGDGVLLLLHAADGSVVAASSFVENGRPARAACRLDNRLGTERCTFWFADGGELSAFDVFRSGGWDRHYADGRDVRIAERTMAPVPFPVGE
jgi:hypothetical protein